MKEIFLTTDDNIKIAVNHFENGGKDVVILAHGWFMTKDSKPFLKLSQMLSEKTDVIAMDCRGHGKSNGFYTFTEKEEHDLKTVVEFAKQRYENITLLGFSLGAALVILHASKHNDVSKVIAVSPPCEFKKIENKFWHPDAWIPTLQKCELKTWFSIRADLNSLIFKKKPSVIKAAETLKTPTLFVGGGKDPTVCIWHTKKLFEKASCTKELEIIEKGLHAEDLFIQNPDRFVKMCENWILMTYDT